MPNGGSSQWSADMSRSGIVAASTATAFATAAGTASDSDVDMLRPTYDLQCRERWRNRPTRFHRHSRISGIAAALIRAGRIDCDDATAIVDARGSRPDGRRQCTIRLYSWSVVPRSGRGAPFVHIDLEDGRRVRGFVSRSTGGLPRIGMDAAPRGQGRNRDERRRRCCPIARRDEPQLTAALHRSSEAEPSTGYFRAAIYISGYSDELVASALCRHSEWPRQFVHTGRAENPARRKTRSDKTAARSARCTSNVRDAHHSYCIRAYSPYLARKCHIGRREECLHDAFC